MVNGSLFMFSRFCCVHALSHKFIRDSVSGVHFHFALLDILAVSTFSAVTSKCCATLSPHSWVCPSESDSISTDSRKGAS